MADEQNEVKNGAGGFLTWSNIRDASILALVFVVTIRLATANINVDLSGFNFTDLLSMFLAVSSVALSAAFYFKADESSRSFYNNSYKFTKDVSEILGRIEAGFGERLRHIDESYTGLSNKFDKMPFDRGAEGGEKQKVAEIQEQEAKQQDIIEELMARAHLADEEKAQLLNRLAKLSDEVMKSKEELLRHRQQADKFQEHHGFMTYMGRRIRDFFDESFLKSSDGRIKQQWHNIYDEMGLDEHDKSYMESRALTRNGYLTSSGVDVVREVIRRAYS
ncbi:hypothetical protein ACTJK9_03880 [Pseudomonas sp. 22082]|jgi:hypothetical protein|uniref:hypothetical protein n=1 Tax=Pseudomonas sp. 22082 TaxID=3453868 RepID=UPI003F87082C